MLFGRPLLGIYTSDQEVIELGMLRLYAMMAAYFACGIINVYPGFTRGMGYSITRGAGSVNLLCRRLGMRQYRANDETP